MTTITFKELKTYIEDECEVVRAIFVDETNHEYVSICGWGTDEGLKLQELKKIEIKKTESDKEIRLEGKGGIYFIDRKTFEN